MKSTISHFMDLITSIANENDFTSLLQRVNRETRETSQADVAVLFILDESGQRLVPVATEYARRRHAEVTELLPIELSETHDVLTAAFNNQQEIVIEVHRDDGDLGQRFSPWFDELDTAHLSFMLFPLANRHDEGVGLLCVAYRDETLHVSSLDDRVPFVRAFSGFAAVTIESQQLIRMQKKLLDSFIKLIAGAIDAKSPYTGGHCQRVPALTSMLAKAACDSHDPRFHGFKLDTRQWEAVNIAAWLHDCGKVTTPEYVVDKSTKLETLCDRIHEIRMRFEVLKRDADIRYWEGVAKGGDAEALAVKRDDDKRKLDEDFHFIAECNLGAEAMAPEQLDRLREIAARRWIRTLDDRTGISWEEAQRKARTPAPSLPVEERLLDDKPEHIIERRAQDIITDNNPWGFRLTVPEHKFNRGELYNLSVTKGTLTNEERYLINDHIVQTIIMLEQLPFPRHLRDVPALAGGHHEKMDGTGYPKRLNGAAMPLVARMMAIADIFEALTAADRPYKKPKTLSESLRIMSFMRKDHHIDADLFELFLRSGVYLDYARQYLAPEQIDSVDVEKLLA